ncbi:MAG: hypothetical protein BMS9Abin07_1662 [Acidimicrobiia bacterium]|nr:MAG: hypothetical protein BMS9Abin07_1662 [Acidimicrobiia bacterium]
MQLGVRFALVFALIGALFSPIGAAGAQESGSSYIAVVNGASTDPVDVTAGEIVIATGLEYAADAVTQILPAGTYDVTFRGGSIDSSVSVEASAGFAQTVVTGYGEGSNTAFAYPADLNPLNPGRAKIVVWNATEESIEYTIFDDKGPTPLEPGTEETFPLPADFTVTITFEGASVEVTATDNSYTDVFAVRNDAQEAALAVAVIPSLSALVEELSAPAPVSVPDVVGETAADAQVALEGAGLVAAAEEASSEDVASGTVIETNPVAGTAVAVGSTVAMVVSTGPDQPDTIPVPDVVGTAAAEAQATLEAEGFTVTTTERSSDDVEAGSVIETNPSAGTEVAPGTTVDMVVSTGAEDVAVPDFTGMAVDEATSAAEAVGLTIRFVEDADDPDPDGVVVDQEPEPGELIAAGSEVVAQLSPAVDDAWAILTVDPDRLMTVTGINFEPGSTTDLRVAGTNLSDAALVDSDGVWVAIFDLSGVENEAETLVVTGTAAGGSDYEQMFTIPAAGESTDVPSDEVEEAEDGGLPWWGWLLIGLGLVGIAVLIWWLVSGRKRTIEDEGGDGASPTPDEGGETATPDKA